MKITAILWDVDSTLLDPREPERVAIRKCFEDFGFGICTDEMLAQYPAINLKWWEKMQTEGKTKQEITVGRFTEFLALCGKDCKVDVEFNNDYMNRLGDTISPVKNAIETVTFFRGKVKQYIATNGLVVSQIKKIKNSGLDKLVDGYFISEDVGFDKPDKRYFDYILESAGITERESVLMVGDALINDMQGANNAGIVSCWYNPEHKVNDNGVRIDYEIDDIEQVKGLYLLK